jgi:hypothetical protein
MSANSDLQLTSENDNVLLKYLNALAKGETHFLATGEKQTLDELFKSVPK